MKKVFLGGTCANSKWRDKFIPMLDKDKIDYFNPVVSNWNEEARQKEIYERKHDDFVLYVLSRAYSTYSIAEVVDDSNKRPNKTICCVLDEPTNVSQHSLNMQEFKHLNQVGKLCVRNGAKYFTSLEEVAEYLNR